MKSNLFNEQEVFKFCTNGDVYHMGKLLDNDKEILPLLKAFLNGQVNPPMTSEKVRGISEDDIYKIISDCYSEGITKAGDLATALHKAIYGG